MSTQTRIREEQDRWGLQDSTQYFEHLKNYCQTYDKRPPRKDTPTKNMLKALRSV